jgi:hypothetical protein
MTKGLVYLLSHMRVGLANLDTIRNHVSDIRHRDGPSITVKPPAYGSPYTLTCHLDVHQTIPNADLLTFTDHTEDLQTSEHLFDIQRVCHSYKQFVAIL